VGHPRHDGYGSIGAVPRLDNPPGWTVVLPFKGGPAAKSRLGAPPGLAVAMAVDCIQACTAAAPVRQVVVVCPAPVPTAVTATAARIVVENRPGIGVALRRAQQLVSGRCAVLPADLAALTPADVVALLDLVEAGPGGLTCFVPDAQGSGTVAVAAGDAARLVLRFGPGSAAAHRAAGCVQLSLPLPRLRRDVDTAADLFSAHELGLGAHTRRIVRPVQATVYSFDPATGTGAVLTDDGVRLPMSATALSGSGLRLLRPGQRVSCLLVGDPDSTDAQVAAVRIAGIGDPPLT
jgi:2-phospho-L-lactate guanylyltransferase